MRRYLIDLDDNVFNYFILPLLGFNKYSFGDNFIKTLMNKLGDTVYVKVIDSNINPLQDNLNFIHSYKEYIVFSVPARFISESKKIIKGEYSKLKEETKKLITETSGLKNTVINSQRVVSKALLALDKHPTLIDFYARELNLSEKEKRECLIDTDIELLDKPYKEDFIDYHIV